MDCTSWVAERTIVEPTRFVLIGGEIPTFPARLVCAAERAGAAANKHAASKAGQPIQIPSFIRLIRAYTKTRNRRCKFKATWGLNKRACQVVHLEAGSAAKCHKSNNHQPKGIL